MKMTAMIWAFGALTLLRLATAAKADDDVGVVQTQAFSAERGVNLAVTVWYPAERGGKPVTLGGSSFFIGTPANLDAPIRTGKYPLVLLSHGAGLGGNPQALSWIATPLARHGYVVAAPTHPGNAGPNRSAAETMKLWLRPGDITATLNMMSTSAAFSAHLDLNRIGMLGLSMGGNTALAIAGARMVPHRLADYCDTDALNASLCGWVRQSGVDLHAMDMTPAGGITPDRRIGFAVAIDPAPADIFDTKSFSGISIPIALVNLGKPGNLPLTTDSSEIAKAIPRASYSTIADASHYSMFAECKPDVPEKMIAEQIGDPVCSDGKGRPRLEIHRELIEMVNAAFDHALRSSHQAATFGGLMRDP